MPAYTAAACIIVFGLIFPLYRVYGIVLVAVIAAAAYFFSKKYFFKDKIIQEESEPVFRTGIAELDESLEQANVLIEQLRRANISIKNPAVSAHIDRMTRSGDAILAELNASRKGKEAAPIPDILSADFRKIHADLCRA